MRPARRGLPCMAEHASAGQGIAVLIVSIGLDLFAYLHSSHHCHPQEIVCVRSGSASNILVQCHKPPLIGLASAWMWSLCQPSPRATAHFRLHLSSDNLG